MVNKDLELLFNTHFIKLSKPMIKIFGLDAAVMLCGLFAEYKYWISKRQLTVDGYFYSTVENIENNYGLSKSQQLKAVDKLVNYGILLKTNRGMPSKRYFQFRYSAIRKLKNDIDQELKTEANSTESFSATDYEVKSEDSRMPKINKDIVF